ncbi:Rieske 2Fe-2S domain-containing protein [Roseibium sp.]
MHFQKPIIIRHRQTGARFPFKEQCAHRGIQLATGGRIDQGSFLCP